MGSDQHDRGETLDHRVKIDRFDGFWIGRTSAKNGVSPRFA